MSLLLLLLPSLFSLETLLMPAPLVKVVVRDLLLAQGIDERVVVERLDGL